jgi:Na+/melibiose symporter-like transporter
MFVVTFIHFALISFQGGAGYQYFTRYANSQASYDVLHQMGLTDATLQPGATAHGFLGTIGYMIPGTRETAGASANSALYGIVGTVSKITQIIGIILAPLLAMRFGKKAVVIAGFLLSVAVNAAFYLLGKNDVVGMLVLTGVFGLVYGPTIPLVWAIFADVADFGEWKLGRRATGIVFATIGFALKAGLAFGGAALGWVEDAVGYNSDNVTEKSLQMFRVCNTLVPALLFVICAGVMFGLWLNKRTTQQMADELAERRNKLTTQTA